MLASFQRWRLEVRGPGETWGTGKGWEVAGPAWKEKWSKAGNVTGQEGDGEMAKQEHVQVKKEAGSLELDTQLQVEQDLNLQVEILEEAISQQ